MIVYLKNHNLLFAITNWFHACLTHMYEIKWFENKTALPQRRRRHCRHYTELFYY